MNGGKNSERTIVPLCHVATAIQTQKLNVEDFSLCLLALKPSICYSTPKNLKVLLFNRNAHLKMSLLLRKWTKIHVTHPALFFSIRMCGLNQK